MRKWKLGAVVAVGVVALAVGCGSDGGTKGGESGGTGGETGGTTGGETGGTTGGETGGETGGTTGGTPDVVTPPPLDAGPPPDTKEQPLSCTGVFDCLGECPAGDAGCQQGCFSKAPANVQQQVNDIIICVQGGPGIPALCAEPTFACLVDNCWPAFQGCFSDAAESLSCSAILFCFQACPQGDQNCPAACLANATDQSIAQQFGDIGECLVEACPTPPGQNPDPTCSQAALSAGGACESTFNDCANDVDPGETTGGETTGGETTGGETTGGDTTGGETTGGETTGGDTTGGETTGGDTTGGETTGGDTTGGDTTGGDTTGGDPGAGKPGYSEYQVLIDYFFVYRYEQYPIDPSWF